MDPEKSQKVAIHFPRAKRSRKEKELSTIQEGELTFVKGWNGGNMALGEELCFISIQKLER